MIVMLSPRLSISFEEAVTLSSIVLRTNNPCLPADREVKEFSDCLRYAKMEFDARPDWRYNYFNLDFARKPLTSSQCMNASNQRLLVRLGLPRPKPCPPV